MCANWIVSFAICIPSRNPTQSTLIPSEAAFSARNSNCALAFVRYSGFDQSLISAPGAGTIVPLTTGAVLVIQALKVSEQRGQKIL